MTIYTKQIDLVYLASNTNISLEFVCYLKEFNIPLLDISYLNSFFNFSTCESKWCNISQYNFKIIDITKLTNVHQELITNSSIKRGNFILLHSPYETIFYYIKSSYIVPFAGLFLIRFNKLTFSLHNVLRKFINLRFFLALALKKTLNRVKTNVNYSKPNNIQNITKKKTLNIAKTNVNYSKPNNIQNNFIPNYLRNIRVYMVDNINTDNKNINFLPRISNQTIDTFRVIDRILRLNQDIVVNTTPNPSVNLNTQIEQLRTNIMALMRHITQTGGAWSSYVRQMQENHQVRIYQDTSSNTLFGWPANIDQNMIYRITRVTDTQTRHYIGLFPDLADMIADLYFALWLIRQSDPSYEFFEECIISDIYPLINNTDGMYFVSDFNERLYTRLYQLIFPNPEPESKSKRRLSDDSDSGNKPSKKRRDGFDDPGNSFCC